MGGHFNLSYSADQNLTKRKFSCKDLVFVSLQPLRMRYLGCVFRLVVLMQKLDVCGNYTVCVFVLS